MALVDLKSELLRLLKEDEEFRYTVAGLLGLREILNELRKLREDFLTFVKEQEKRWEENNRRSSRIEMELGSLSESLYCRYVSEDIEKELAAAGERVTSRMRNADFDGVEVDLAIITDRAVYIVEAKTKPTRRAVEALLAKAEAVQRRTGKPVVPILTGALIGREIEAYARSKGVRVYKY
ncbi:MAG: hypothetical protein QXT28_11620 [Thermofilaceae archaeon]